MAKSSLTGFCPTGEREPTGNHLFDQKCAEHSIEHRLIKPKKPQTNGMAQRFNGRIQEIVQQTRFESAQKLEEALIQHLNIYDSNIPQRNIGHVMPTEAVSKWRKTHPELFKKPECNHPGLDTYDDSGGSLPCRHVDSLDWTEAEKQQGKTVKIRDFPSNCKVKLFRVEISAKRTEHVVTNDMTQDNTQVVQKCAPCAGKSSRHHWETKQFTGLEGCQCRKARTVRNHIACAILVWVHLKHVANETKQTVYRLKHGLLSDYLKQQLKSSAIHMTFA